MRSVNSADLGVDPAKTPPGAWPRPRPFVPLKPPALGRQRLQRQLYRINVARAEINQYSHTLVAVPLLKPVGGR